MKIDTEGFDKIDKEIERCENEFDKVKHNGKEFDILSARIQGLLSAKRYLLPDW